MSLCVVRTNLAISPAHAHCHSEHPQACEARRGRERNLLCGGRSDTTSIVLASKSHVLYVGVTGLLLARVLQHKSGECEGLTARYEVNRMVHFEVFQYVNNDRTGNGDQEVAAGKREKKVALLEANNPTW